MLKLKDVSVSLKLDVAIVSKLERGDRKATKKQVLALIDFYKLNKKQILILWLSERILDEIDNQEFALDALYAAEKGLKQLVASEKDVVLNAEVKALLEKIDKLKKKWKLLVDSDQFDLSEIKEYSFLNNTFESNKIEGNTLNFKETEAVINEGVTIAGKSMHEHLEAVNHFDALEFVEEFVKKGEDLNESILKEIHQLLLKGIDRKNAGKYRQEAANLTGSKYVAPSAVLIDKKVEETFQFYHENLSKIHPILLALEVHEKIISLQPFKKGTDITARLLMNLILMKNGFPIVSIKGDLKSKKFYYTAIDRIQLKNEPKDLQLLMCNLALASLEDSLDKLV